VAALPRERRDPKESRQTGSIWVTYQDLEWELPFESIEVCPSRYHFGRSCRMSCPKNHADAADLIWDSTKQ